MAIECGILISKEVSPIAAAAAEGSSHRKTHCLPRQWACHQLVLEIIGWVGAQNSLRAALEEGGREGGGIPVCLPPPPSLPPLGLLTPPPLPPSLPTP